METDDDRPGQTQKAKRNPQKTDDNRKKWAERKRHRKEKGKKAQKFRMKLEKFLTFYQ